MSSKVELQGELNDIGYQLGSFASKGTLSNVRRLHSSILTDRNLNVGELSDVELRKILTKLGLLVGPITNHTRPIYQRKLLEVLTNETTEGSGYDSDRSIPESDDENSIYPNLSEREPFSYDEPMTIRNDYRATTSTRNTIRDRNSYNTSNEIRSRIPTKTNEQQTIKIIPDATPKKDKANEKQSVATKSSGTFLYASITIIVALLVFALYFFFGN